MFFWFRHVTLFEELVLLKEFEKRENTFANRVKTKENEKQDMLDKVIIIIMKKIEERRLKSDLLQSNFSCLNVYIYFCIYLNRVDIHCTSNYIAMM